MYRITTLLLSLLALTGYSQDSPRAHYSFDGCSPSDATGLNADTQGLAGCQCGVVGDAATIIGNTINLDTMVTDWLLEDYSISFYFRSDNTEAFVDLLSIRSQCNQDSTIAFTYLVGSDEVEVLMSLNDNNRRRLKGSLNPNVCWHQVTLVKSGLNVFLYLDNALAIDDILPGNIPYSQIVPMRISGSPCQGITDSPLNGAIDELKIFDRPLSAMEIFTEYPFPGQIISNDTTIFEGASVDIKTGKSCASSILWTPAAGLDDSTSPDPIATPDVTTTYTVRFDDGTCVAEDEITINVLDPSQLACDTLLLPAAFTPNGDMLNDVYGISNRFIIETLESFIIRDRWGSIVFETTNKNATWDGSFGGQAPNPGTYLYTIIYTCSGQEFSKVGSFVLLR